MTVEFVGESTVKLVQVLASDDAVALAAWVSFDADTQEKLKDLDRKEGLINFLLKNRHTSPFEHGYFQFEVVTPIFVAREHMRHRTQSYNEMSGRYTIMKPEFYVPTLDRPMIQEGKAGQYKFSKAEEWKAKIVRGMIAGSCRASWRVYEGMLALGIAKEVARMVLPVTIMTRYTVSIDPLNLMRFLTLRTHPQALYEIREVAADMEQVLADHMPFTYAAWKKFWVEG